jgi:hypothetical protein
MDIFFFLILNKFSWKSQRPKPFFKSLLLSLKLTKKITNKTPKMSKISGSEGANVPPMQDITFLHVKCQAKTRTGDMCSRQAKVQVDMQKWANVLDWAKSKLPKWAVSHTKTKVDCCRYCLPHASMITLLSVGSLAIWLKKKTMTNDEYYAADPDKTEEEVRQTLPGYVQASKRSKTRKKKQGKTRKSKRRSLV